MRISVMVKCMIDQTAEAAVSNPYDLYQSSSSQTFTMQNQEECQELDTD